MLHCYFGWVSYTSELKGSGRSAARLDMHMKRHFDQAVMIAGL
jgi:hypothetical protein